MTTIDITALALGENAKVEHSPRVQAVSTIEELEMIKSAKFYQTPYFTLCRVSANYSFSNFLTPKEQNFKPILFINQNNPKPFTIKVNHRIAEEFRVKQQAKRDLKTDYNKAVADPLFLQVIDQSVNNPTNGKNPYWIGLSVYWAGYARGIREQRQKDRAKRQDSRLGALTGNDIADLATQLNLSSNAVSNAILELVSRKEVLK